MNGAVKNTGGMALTVEVHRFELGRSVALPQHQVQEGRPYPTGAVRPDRPPAAGRCRPSPRLPALWGADRREVPQRRRAVGEQQGDESDTEWTHTSKRQCLLHQWKHIKRQSLAHQWKHTSKKAVSCSPGGNTQVQRQCLAHTVLTSAAATRLRMAGHPSSGGTARLLLWSKTVFHG